MISHYLSKVWKTYFLKTPTNNLRKSSGINILKQNLRQTLEEYKRIEHVDDGDIFPFSPKYAQKDNRGIRVWHGKNLL